MLEGKYKMFYCRLSFHTNTNDGHYDDNGVFLFLKWYFVFSPDTLDANLKYILTKHPTFIINIISINILDVEKLNLFSDFGYIYNITTFSRRKN